VRWESVLAWRVERQHLARRAKDPLAVISDVCGLHAQVMSSAQLTLWARVEDPPEVEELLWERRVLVKTWAMRGTLHLLRNDELPLYVAAPRDTRATSAPERIYRKGGWFSPVLLVDGVMAGVWSRQGDEVTARLPGAPTLTWQS
jgi:hypothetical protein